MTETWSWIDPTGAAVSMDAFAAGLMVVEGVEGRGIPPIRRTRDVVAGQPGSRLRDVKHDMRTLTMPVFVKGATETDRSNTLEAWMGRIDPSRGTGALDLTNATGITRRLYCRYAQGLELVEDGSHRFPGAQLAVVTFEADDPYWYDANATSIRFSATSTVPKFFNTSGTIKRILPITLGASAVLGGATVTADSDVEVWPKWTVTGPGSSLVIRNNTTGREFLWSGTLTTGQSLIVDTRPGIGTVLRETGLNMFSYLTAWDLWPFIPGINDIDVTMSGTSAGSAILAEWTNRHLQQ